MQCLARCLKWVSFVVFSCICAQVIAAQSYDINAQCRVDVTEVAKVKTEDDSKIPTTGWESTQLPDNWSKSWSGYNGAAWYKIHWHLACQDQHSITEPIAFSIDYINSAGATFLNGDLLWSDRHLQEPLSKSWNVPRYWIFPISSLKSGNNEILVYVTGYHYQKAGLGKIEFNNLLNNNEKHLKKVWDRRTLFQINLILSGTIGVICLVIWLFRRSETTFGWFSLSCLLWILFASNLLSTENFPFSSSLWASKVNGIFFAAYIHCFIIYLFRFIHQQNKKLEQTFWGILLLLSLALLLSSIDVLAILLSFVFALYILLFVLMVAYVSYSAVKTKNGEFLFLAICLLSILFFISIDIYTYNQDGASESSLLSPYTSPVITAFVVLILGFRLNKNLLKIEKFNQHLTEKIHMVSQDLKQSLDEKHQLEIDNVRLQERIHLSHELHDGLGASLVRSMVLVDQSADQIPNKHVLSMLKVLRDDLRQIIDSGSSLNTKVPETPIFWIAPVRYRFMQLMEDLDIDVKWDFPQHWATVPTAIQCLSLIRIVEEGLTNVIKHSQATQVKVSLAYVSEHALALIVEDNGVGFDIESVQQHGLSIGMRSMHLRMEKMGGSLKIKSRKGCTRIQAIIQLT